MVSREHGRRGREGGRRGGAEGATVLPFPAVAACSGAADDFLIDRLRNDDPARTGRCVSQWADPMDAAILAALLLGRPALELHERQRLACAAGRDAEARFWREAGDLLTAITSAQGVGGNP